MKKEKHAFILTIVIDGLKAEVGCISRAAAISHQRAYLTLYGNKPWKSFRCTIRKVQKRGKK